MPAALPALTPLTLSSITRVRCGIRLHPFGRVKEEIGRRLAAFHHLRGIEPSVEMRCETGQGKRKGHAIEIAGRGDASAGSAGPPARRLRLRSGRAPIETRHGLLPSVRRKIAPDSSVPMPRSARAPPSRFVQGTDRAPDRHRARCRIPARTSERQRQLSTSLSTNTPSQSKMMRSGLIIARVSSPR